MSWSEEIEGKIPDDDVRKIMGGNMFGLLGLHEPA